MSRNIYIIIVTLVFAIISIPSLVNTVFHERVIQSIVDVAFTKTIMIFFILIMENSLIKKKAINFIIGILSSTMLIGVLFKVMHWPLGVELIGYSAVGLVAIFLIYSLTSKRRHPVHYLLLLFVPIRVLIILTPPHSFTWWLDFIICVAIFISGLAYLTGKKRKHSK